MGVRSARSGDCARAPGRGPGTHWRSESESRHTLEIRKREPAHTGDQKASAGAHWRPESVSRHTLEISRLFPVLRWSACCARRFLLFRPTWALPGSSRLFPVLRWSACARRFLLFRPTWALPGSSRSSAGPPAAPVGSCSSGQPGLFPALPGPPLVRLLPSLLLAPLLDRCPPTLRHAPIASPATAASAVARMGALWDTRSLRRAFRGGHVLRKRDLMSSTFRSRLLSVSFSEPALSSLC